MPNLVTAPGVQALLAQNWQLTTPDTHLFWPCTLYVPSTKCIHAHHQRCPNPYACFLWFSSFAPFQMVYFLYFFYSFTRASLLYLPVQVPVSLMYLRIYDRFSFPTESLSWSCFWMESRLAQSSWSRGGSSRGVLLILHLMGSEVWDKAWTCLVNW